MTKLVAVVIATTAPTRHRGPTRETAKLQKRCFQVLAGDARMAPATSALPSLGASPPRRDGGRDTITDFAPGKDVIRLDDDIFKALSIGALAPSQFASGPGVSTAGDENDRIIYNSTTGVLFYDPDGTGTAAAVKFALLGTNAHPAISAADFLIIG